MLNFATAFFFLNWIANVFNWFIYQQQNWLKILNSGRHMNEAICHCFF